MRASSKRPRVESSSGVAPPPPPSLVDPTVEEYVDPMAVAIPPPFTSDDSSIHHMWTCSQSFKLYMQSWQALDEHLHHHLLIMSLDCPLDGDRGRFFFVLELWSFRLYLGASLCTFFFFFGS